MDETKKKVCVMGCARYKLLGYCSHTSYMASQEMKTARAREKEEQRVRQAMFSELEVPEWQVVDWVEWQSKKITHKAGVYVFVDESSGTLCIGGGTDVNRRMYAWWAERERDFVPRDARQIWVLETQWWKEMTIATRLVVGWDSNQLRDPLRGATWSGDIAHQVLTKHPAWLISELSKVVDVAEYYEGVQGAD